MPCAQPKCYPHRAIERGSGSFDFKAGILRRLVGYAIIRFFLEFTREPDAQLGFVFGALSMGQVLSIIMLAAGVALLGMIYLGRGASPRPPQSPGAASAVV
jgi:hypothetical protein